MDESLSPCGWEDATEELVLENREQLHHNLIISDQQRVWSSLFFQTGEKYSQKALFIVVISFLLKGILKIFS